MNYVKQGYIYTPHADVSEKLAFGDTRWSSGELQAYRSIQ